MCSAVRNVEIVLSLIVLVSLMDVKSVTGKRPPQLRDFIATDHLQAASDVNVKTLRKKPMKDLSRKDMIEILHSSNYFQDLFMEHFAPLKIQFGHVCEDPHEWQQRFEQRDFEGNRHQGKVRWGNKNGDYGEQYWDLNH